MTTNGSWSNSKASFYTVVNRPYGSSLTVVQSFAYPSYSISVSRYGGITPGYGKFKRKSGFLPVNGFQYDFLLNRSWNGIYVEKTGLSGLNSTSGSYVRTGSQPLPTYIGSELTVTQMTASRKAAIDGAARSKVLTKVKDQKINLAQAFAERAQTSRTIAETATQVAKALINLKKGNLALAAQALGVHVGKRASRAYSKGFRKGSRAEAQAESLSRGWLALQYGWKPLLNDIYGACDFIATNSYGTRLARAHASERGADPNVTTVRGTSGDTKGSVLHLSGNSAYEVKYVCYFKPSDPLATDLRSLGISNPALVAWELMPWSFVIDWFLPIGSWIGTWDATIGLTFVTGSKTIYSRERYDLVYVQPGVESSNRFYSWSLSKDYDKVSVTRTVLTQFPFPYFPEFRNPVSGLHIANALALFKTARK